MTLIKAKLEERTIFDFSNGKYSKNKIKNYLDKTEIIHSQINDNMKDIIVYLNEIKIGIYTIKLQLPFDSSSDWKRLKDYKDFSISISEGDDKINLDKDLKFKNQYWVSKNLFGHLKIKHLIDIISYCNRLNNLRSFL